MIISFRINWQLHWEEFAVLVASLHYLFCSILVFHPIQSLLHTTFLSAFLIALPAGVALALVVILTTQDKPRPSCNAARDGDEIRSLICLFAVAIALLLQSAMTTSSTYDELTHVNRMYLASTTSLHDFCEVMQTTLYSPWWYILIGSLLNSTGGVSLLRARILICIISSFVIVPMYRLARDVFHSRSMAIAICFAFIFSSIFHLTLFYVTMDGIATLFFTLSVHCFLRGISRRSPSLLLSSGVSWSALALAHYGSALQLILGYLLSLLYLQRRHIVQPKDVMPICLGFLIFPILDFPVLLHHIPRFLELGLELLPVLNATQYNITMIWDLLLSAGWSPFLVLFLIMARRLICNEPRIEDKTIPMIFLGSAFVVYFLMNSYAILRRLAPVSPLFLILIAEHSAENYSRITVALVLLNFCWWGLLQFFLGVIPGLLFG